MLRLQIKRATKQWFAIIMTFITVWFMKTRNISVMGKHGTQITTKPVIPFQSIIYRTDTSVPLLICNRDVSNELHKNDTFASGRIVERFQMNKHHVVVIDIANEIFTESANRLTNTAFADGIDYFFLICKSSIHIKRDLAGYCIHTLVKHTVPNIGAVVVADITSETYFLLVHRSHIEMFHQIFQEQVNISIAIKWIKHIYRPYHLTLIHTQICKVPFPQTFTQDLITTKEFEVSENAKKTVRDYIVSKVDLMVISYSLYGSDSRYTDGALANAALVKVIYPNWRLWIYHDNNVPLSVLSTVCDMDHVNCINMTGTMLINKRSWRFLVASVDFICRFVVRDIDSRLSVRERDAVNEWIVSGKTFHVMRDHPAHSENPINAGLWGGTGEAITNMEYLLQDQIKDCDFIEDTTFLNNIVWPIAKYSVYQHDSFTCDKFGGAHPFPSKRIGLEHVGSVYINGKMREKDSDILQKSKSPIQCISYQNA